jgi:hypothetical protein
MLQSSATIRAATTLRGSVGQDRQIQTNHDSFIWPKGADVKQAAIQPE